jgi:predicted DNA-binding transcriptional regulator AlpA
MRDRNHIGRIPMRLPVPPRGLSRAESARYVGVSPAMFDALVKDGRMPPPKRINARTVWDIRRLDDAFEALSNDEDEDHDPFARVVLRRN